MLQSLNNYNYFCNSVCLKFIAFLATSTTAILIRKNAASTRPVPVPVPDIFLVPVPVPVPDSENQYPHSPI